MVSWLPAGRVRRRTEIRAQRSHTPYVGPTCEFIDVNRVSKTDDPFR